MNFKTLYPTIVLVAATLFFAFDIIVDLDAKDESWLHLFVESIVFLAI